MTSLKKHFLLFGTSSSCVEALRFWNEYLARGGISTTLETWATKILGWDYHWSLPELVWVQYLLIHKHQALSETLYKIQMIIGIETRNIYMYQYLWMIIPMFPIPYISRSWTCLDSFFSTLWITSIWNLSNKFYNFVGSFSLDFSFSLISKFCWNDDSTSLHTIFIIIGIWGDVN